MVLTNPLSGIIEQPSSPEAQSFDYGSLDSETRIVVQQRTSEIKSLIRQTAQDIIDIGQKLIKVKQQLEHGNFRNWLKAEFEWGISTATKFMHVANRFKCVNLTHLSITASALYLLAAPCTPELASEGALSVLLKEKSSLTARVRLSLISIRNQPSSRLLSQLLLMSRLRSIQSYRL